MTMSRVKTRVETGQRTDNEGMLTKTRVCSLWEALLQRRRGLVACYTNERIL